jgi:hypothetical protein
LPPELAALLLAENGFIAVRGGLQIRGAIRSQLLAGVTATGPEMRELPDSKQVLAALPRVAPGLQKYCWLQSELPRRDVSRDTEFQRRFAGFYRVRRGTAWRHIYFDLLQSRKTSSVTFAEALRSLRDTTGKVEASFASKLVATIDPTQPVIDSIVFKNLGLTLPPRSAADRLEQLERMYALLSNWYREQVVSSGGRELIRLFRAAYPQAAVTDTKALDLVLWQIRPAA